VYAGNNNDNLSGCTTERKRFFVTHRSETGDNHPNEYRPTIHLDSAVIIVPDGWHVGDVWWINNTLMSPSDYSIEPNGTLTLRRPAGYADYDKIGTASLSFYVEFTADCRANNGYNNFLYTAYYKEYAYLTDPSSQISRTTSDNVGGFNYTAPSYSIIALNQTVSAYADTVQWKIRVCNNTSDMDVAYNWLALENEGNLITVDSVRDVTIGADSLLNISTLPGGGTYTALGDINQGVCKDLIIYSRYTSCDIDTLDVSHGWSCVQYPALSEIVACSAQNELYISPQSAQISSSITPLATTPIDPYNPSGGDWGSSNVDMCSEFPMELTVVNSQPGNLYDVAIKLRIPSLGSGLNYVPGSATIEVEGIDAPNVSRAIGAAGESALLAASSANNPNWNVTLAQLDPTNYGSGAPLSGTFNPANNQFILRWQMESTCNQVSGDFVRITVNGNDPCGVPANGSNERIQSFPININGATPPYYSFFTTDISPDNAFEGCSDLKSVDVEILISGGVTGTQDTLEVILPDGVGYAGGYNCNTPGMCPIFIGSNIIGDEEVLTFGYPSGVTGTIDFSIDIDTDSRGDCFASANISFFNKTIIGGLTCGGSTCPSTRVITGSDNLSISMEKPILSISYNSLSVYRGNTTNLFYYNMNITNTGLSTDNNIIADFYCLNATGDDIIGAPVASDTLTALLANGATDNLAGEFKATCDTDDGIGVLLVPEYDNCYCTALESLSDKSPGLSEIPHDVLTSIPPFACPSAMTNRQVSFRIVRSID
jgi:large repetitive protein